MNLKKQPVAAWKLNNIRDDLIALPVDGMKRYCLLRRSELKTYYLSYVSNLPQRRKNMRDLFLQNARESVLDFFVSDWYPLEYSFLFEDRFQLSIEAYLLAKLRSVRFEFIHDALFSVKDSEAAREVIRLGLNDASKLVRINAVRAAAYSSNDMYLKMLCIMAETETDKELQEDCIYAIKSIEQNNQHIFVRRVPFEDKLNSWLIVNRWDVKTMTPPGMQEHLLAGELIKDRDTVLKIVKEMV